MLYLLGIDIGTSATKTVLFDINGSNARDYASQGQLRSAALTLKLAEAELIRRAGTRPVIILDDILSELDGDRRHFILNQIDDFLNFQQIAVDVSVFLNNFDKRNIDDFVVL